MGHSQRQLILLAVLSAILVASTCRMTSAQGITNESIWNPFEQFMTDSIAKSLSGNLQFALNLFDESDYYRAITEFKRFKWITGERSIREATDFMIGMSYYQARRLNEAKNIFLDLSESAESSQLRTLSTYKLGETLYEKSEFRSAAIAFRSIRPETKNALGFKSGVMESISYAKDGEWPYALKTLASCREDAPDASMASLVDSALSITSEYQHLPTRSPTLAAVLSAAIPGSGYLYCGRYTDGLMAFIINGAIVFIAYESARDGYISGDLIAVYFGLAFYLGNIYGARQAAHRYNHRSSERLVSRLEQVFQSINLSITAHTNGFGVQIGFHARK